MLVANLGLLLYGEVFVMQRLQIPTCEMPVIDHFEEVLKLGETLTEGDQVNVSCYKINVFAR